MRWWRRACGAWIGSREPPAPTPTPAPTAVASDMAALLRTIAEQARETSLFTGERAARELRAELEAKRVTLPPRDRLRLERWLAFHELRLGRIEERLEVFWPTSGRTLEVDDVAAGSRLELIEPAAAPAGPDQDGGAGTR